MVPGGRGTIRSSRGPEHLETMSEMIAEIAHEVDLLDDEDPPPGTALVPFHLGESVYASMR